MKETKSFLLRMVLGVFALGLVFYFLRLSVRNGAEPPIHAVKPPITAPPKTPPVTATDPGEEIRRDVFPLDDLLEEEDARAAFLYQQRLSDLDLAQFPAAMGDLISRTFSERREQFVAILLKRWTALDPRGALASEIDRAGNASKYISLILGNWTAASPTEAWQWARSSIAELPQPSKGAQATARFGAVVSALAEQRNFTIAASLISQDGADTYWNSAALVKTWAGTDFAGASRWVLGLPKGPTRQATLGALVESFAATDFDLAMTFAGQLSQPDEINISAQAIVAGLRQSGDTERILTWTANLAGENTSGIYDSAISSAVMSLSKDKPFDAQAARDLLSKMKDSSQRSAIASVLINTVKSTSYPTAAVVALEFLEGPRRNQELGSLMSQWANSNSDTAMTFVQSDPRIPQDLRPKMISWVQGGTMTPR